MDRSGRSVCVRSDRSARRPASARAAPLLAALLDPQSPLTSFKPLVKEQRVVAALDALDPKALWPPGNRAWSMSQTVRNHNTCARERGRERGTERQRDGGTEQ